MIGLLRKTGRRTDRHSGTLLLLSLAASIQRGWHLWRHGQALLAARPVPATGLSFETWPSLPKVSALVAAWNEADTIACHIKSFLALRYPNKQLVLCAGGGDTTYDLAQHWAGPQVILLEQQPGEGKQRALQRCLPLADGDIIILTDADCLFSDEAFNALIGPLATGHAEVVTGLSEPKCEQRQNTLVQYQWFTDLAWSWQLPQTVDGVLGRNCALRRSVVDELRPFDTPVATGTDYFLSRLLTRAGYAIHAVPQSRMATRYPASPGSYLRMWRRWHKNLLIHGVRFGAWQDVKGVLVAGLLNSLILLWPALTPRLGIRALFPSILLFGLASIRRWRRLTIGAHLAGTAPSWSLIARIPMYTWLDMLAIFLAVHDAILPKTRKRW